MHYGLLPRANRGIFAINELPDLAGKIQVGLFNILQEGDVQIKGYPIRLPLDVMLVFTANPEDYTARGKIITPLKDRIGSEIRTHYPATRQHAMAITAQEAWTDRAGDARGRDSGLRARGRRGDRVPGARRSQDRQALRRQPAPADHDARERRLERRAPRAAPTARRSSCRASPTSTRRCPSITGKFELEYEGELHGAEQVARDLIRVGRRQRVHRHLRRRRHAHGRRVVRPRRHAAARATRTSADERDRADARRPGPASSSPSARGRRAGRAGAARRLGDRLRARRAVRAEEDQPQRRARLSTAAEAAPRRPARREEQAIDEEIRMPGGKKKYYN